MIAAGAVLVGGGAFYALLVAASRREHSAGMHALIWGSALVVAGSVR